MENIIPVVEVVYKPKSGNWRGFCYPYDVSCNADTREATMGALDSLVSAYEESLERHNNPKHLILKKLTDEEDEVVFKRIWPEISRKIAEYVRQSRSPTSYSDYLSQNKKFILKSGQSTVSLSHRSLCPAS